MYRKNNINGFTFIEILVTMAIIIILVSLTVVVTLNVRVKARDSQRISDATEIMTALESYYATNKFYPEAITVGQPIKLGSTELLNAVPKNPFPRNDGDCADQEYTYTTIPTGYELTFCLGQDHSRFTKGVVVCRNGNCGYKDDCSGMITDIDGTQYPIVRIGDQCWMGTHLKSKKRPEPEGTCINIDNGYTVDPVTCLTSYSGNEYGGFGGCPNWCTPGSRRDCIKNIGPTTGGNFGWDDRGFDISSVYDYPAGATSSCNYHGALYTWSGAMNLADSCNGQLCAAQITSPHRGVCPLGWHIPTDQEFHILESTLKGSTETCDGNRNSHIPGTDSCRNSGTEMISGDFQAILLGIRQDYNGTNFSGINNTVYFWTATNGNINAYEAFVRAIDVGVNGTYRFEESKDTAAAVRCIRDI